MMILVTGATGMLGSHLLLELLKQNKKVKALKREESNCKFVEKLFSRYTNDYSRYYKNIEWVNADISDYYELKQVFSDIDIVYHCAAFVSFKPSDKNKIKLINIEGTANIVNLCIEHKVKKLCHVSSIAALGSTNNNSVVTEETKRNSNEKESEYSKSKYKSELEVWRGIAEGLNAVIVNPSVILGPGDWTKGSPSIISTVAKGLRFFTLGTTGFVDVSDVVNAMILLTESDISGERFIINGENLTYKSLFEIIAKALKVNPPQKFATPHMTEIAWRFFMLRYYLTGKNPVITKETARTSHKVSRYSNEKIINRLDFQFKSINDSILHICKIYQSK